MMWDATPQSVLRGSRPPSEAKKTSQPPNDATALSLELGTSMSMRNMRADLALMHSTKAGYWTGDFIEQDVISESELVKAVEEADGAINESGHYPLPDELKERLLNVLKHNL